MKRIYLLSILTFVIIHFSCKKDFLEIKPDQSLLVPTKLSDMQRILDNVEIMNYSTGLPSLSTDDYDLSITTLNSFALPAERNAYVWAEDIFELQDNADWNLPYQQMFYANVVLDALAKMSLQDQMKTEWKNIKGSALFYRAFSLYQLSEEFTSPYNLSTLSITAGIPIKLTSDVNERPGRGTLKELFERIFTDLNEAVQMLPEKQELYLTRPSKTACFALMARISLATGDYQKALKYSDECLKISPSLLDFNVLSSTSNRPISADRIEVIFNQYMIDYSFTSSTALNINPSLIALYSTNDLRKSIYFRDRGNGVNTFKGNYTGNRYIFTGLAVDEQYLIRAECKARENDTEGAMEDLNRLLIMRWNNKTPYQARSATNSENAVKIIIDERRKELVTRGTRWADLRRLNQDSRFAITLKRNIDNKEYTLNPNDLRYTFPIPQNEINISGIEQNRR